MGSPRQPSGITRQFGHYVVVAGKDRELIEVKPNGEVVQRLKLKKKSHVQSEGVGFMSDGRLVLADEGRGSDAAISIYTPNGIH